MRSSSESACLLIADISGYTVYLAGVELDHAQDILADLVDTVVGSLRPGFRFAKLEGDAAFMYLPGDSLDASTLFDTVEHCYASFRRRLRDITQSSSCECNACVRIPTLDLKFLVHHGQIAHQRMAGSAELVGRDVIVVHRLLKNGITQTFDLPAYAFYTQACIDAGGIKDVAGLGWWRHHESYDGIGQVDGWVADLAAAWRAREERTRTYVSGDDAFHVVERVLAAPPELVWDYVTSPARRPQWQTDTDAVNEQTPSGRRGPGTINHCMHGKNAVVEEVLDWRPFDYVTVRSKLPLPGIPKVTTTIALDSIAAGTRVQFRVERPRQAKDRAILLLIRREWERRVVESLDALSPIVQEESARRATETAVEPIVPASPARHLREPVSGPIRYVDAPG